MNQVGKFEKVSFEQFCLDAQSKLGFDAQKDALERAYFDFLRLPRRSDPGSAGYDFVAPMGFKLAPGESIALPTGIRVRIDDGWWLMCVPRSGLGTKFRMQLDNTVGVIDSSYYYADNEGHIMMKFTNDSRENKDLVVNAGDRVFQGIFLPYGITVDDDATGKRTGCFGSSGT